MTVRTDAFELWLIWQNPKTRQRYHVGTLAHHDMEYEFLYECHGPRTLRDAVANGYQLHLAFPSSSEKYVSNELFAAFSCRLPDTKRSDFSSIVKRIGLSQGFTQMDLLMATGGRLATDTYEFVRPLVIHDGELHIDFPVAGWHYYDGLPMRQLLKSNTPIQVQLDTENKFDRNAVLVLATHFEMTWPDGHHGKRESAKNVEFSYKALGYVPAYYSWAVAELLRQGVEVRARISPFDASDDTDTPVWIALTSRATTIPSSMEFAVQV